jgi:sugar phosphate permease
MLSAHCATAMDPAPRVEPVCVCTCLFVCLQLWGINGFCQGCIYPLMIALVGANLTSANRGTVLGLWSTNATLGAVTATSAVGYVLKVCDGVTLSACGRKWWGYWMALGGMCAGDARAGGRLAGCVRLASRRDPGLWDPACRHPTTAAQCGVSHRH